MVGEGKKGWRLGREERRGKDERERKGKGKDRRREGSGKWDVGSGKVGGR